jgi:putative endonuclease
MAKHNDDGKAGEEAAWDFLKENGVIPISKNQRFGRSEVDIIAKEGDSIIFVEVKTRKSSYFGTPDAFITDAKEASMARAASIYMEQTQFKGEIRFDVVTVIMGDEGPLSLEHFRDAF